MTTRQKYSFKLFLLIALALGILTVLAALSAFPQTPYPGTTREICAAHGQQYDAKAKGCVVPVVKPALPSTTPTRRVNKDNGGAK